MKIRDRLSGIWHAVHWFLFDRYMDGITLVVALLLIAGMATISVLSEKHPLAADTAIAISNQEDQTLKTPDTATEEKRKRHNKEVFLLALFLIFFPIICMRKI